MAKRIIADLSPFSYNFNIVVQDIEKKKKTVSVIESVIEKPNLINYLLSTTEKECCQDIVLLGPISFTEGIKRQLQQEELKKYSNNKLNIVLKKGL